MVEVKSLEEIRHTLDGSGRSNGLFFMPGMEQFCGQRRKVLKRIERIKLETTNEIRLVSHTVLLEGTICDGEGSGCDRSCFYFWRNEWLKKVPDDPTPSP